MKLLAIDPSSTRTGVAMFDGLTLSQYGLVRPNQSRPAEDRIDDSISGVHNLCEQWRPDAAVIEIPSGKVARRNRGGGAGLATYGVAAGEMRRFLKVWLNHSTLAPTVFSVNENEWTGGTPKAHRAGLIRVQFPGVQWDSIGDTGHDLADAVGLGQWWIEHQRIADVLKRVK